MLIILEAAVLYSAVRDMLFRFETEPILLLKFVNESAFWHYGYEHGSLPEVAAHRVRGYVPVLLFL